MSAQDHTKTIQAMYEAFGRGDVEAILESVDDNVDWGADTNSTVAPWYGARKGKDGVVSFFQDFGSTMEIEEFTPITLMANDDTVLSILKCRAKVRANGNKIDMNLHHWFTFRNGKVVHYRGTEDSAQVEAALKG